ncbi:MAG: hypothetical protein RLZZ142_2933 [Verrucomicrobiota bacterium]
MKRVFPLLADRIRSAVAVDVRFRRGVGMGSLAWFLVAFAVGVPASAGAAVRLSPPFSKHMVLQREFAVPVWGDADPGEEVTVEFAGQRKTAVAGADGRWEVRLDAMAASSEGRTLTVRGKNEVSIPDVLVGEVWLATGQANMSLGLVAAHNAAEELSKAIDPLLRFFTVKKHVAAEPRRDGAGTWQLTTPETARWFSAVGYFFAKELRERLGCPVAVLHASWGGAPAQTWMSLGALKGDPAFREHVVAYDRALARSHEVRANTELVEGYERKLKEWKEQVEPSRKKAVDEWLASVYRGEKRPWPSDLPGEPVNPDPFGTPSQSGRTSIPAGLFNGMIFPLAPYGMRGVICYQGESNGSQGLEYRKLFPALILDWRKHWGRELPFLYVQLAGWDFHPDSPEEKHSWPWLREAQRMALSVPRTGMAVAVDVGDPKSVHPSNKEVVGQRLALVARKVAYGEAISCSGPVYSGIKAEAKALRVLFQETGRGLVIGQAPWHADGVEPLGTDRLVGFAIAGEDRKWFRANAEIQGDTVLVWHPEVPEPVAVRYGWANAPRCNLYNREGLPAGPFRSDEWR